jgi:hypothetical protein
MQKLNEILKKGNILLRENKEYKWMFKLVGVNKEKQILYITNPIDIFPKPRFFCEGRIPIYKCISNDFFSVYEEYFVLDSKRMLRLPTKNELQLYNKYTRKARLLGDMTIYLKKE